MKAIKRQSSNTKILLLKDWKEVYLELNEILTNQEVDWIIRIQNSDFDKNFIVLLIYKLRFLNTHDPRKRDTRWEVWM